MSELLDRLNTLSPKRLALLVMDLQAKLDQAAERAPEPIAIIGLACRVPEADSPEAFWQLMEGGVDAVREIPGERFDVDNLFDPDPEAPGKIATRWGGFVEGIERFDAGLFGIAPREAAGMDPQQRLLLETAWEALERAGYAPDSLRGSRTGVFAGLCNGDYGQMLLGGDRNLVDAYTATGSAHSVAAGRISYILGLQGPSIAVDTACSSSLVAVHLAVQSLRAGECRMALAGGSNVIISPDTTITLSRARMMAPDGRCKAFDASADGFVRSEGCGVVALKRLADAEADGDPILAVIRGSAINQDGRSNGLTAPNGPSQEAVIRSALADARLAPRDVHYVEAHGTGTSLGDPIEAQALGAALGDRDGNPPLVVGSVKSNLGHLEAAAGVAGLIKIVLMLQRGQVPPSLHFKEPSPHIPWDRLPLRVPTSLEPWPVAGERRVAGVSSFGFSGTNVHLLVEAAPEPEARTLDAERPWHAIKLAAADDGALRELAGRYAASLAAPDAPALADFAHTANVARSDLARRAVVPASDIATARQALEALAVGENPDGVSVGSAGQRAPKVAFLFTGQGTQYAGMGRNLYETQPVFRSALDRCAELVEPHLDIPLLDLIFAEPGSPEAALLDETTYTQPALFAIEYAMAELWASWGVRPAAVVGHSLGEFAAACVAGILSLEDGLRLVAARGKLMGSLPPGGAMASVFASETQVQDALGRLADDLAFAAINGPTSVTLSGDRASVEEAAEQLRAAGLEARMLAISLAGHSPLVEPILQQFEAEAASVTHAAPQIDFVSGLHGRPVQGAEINAGYWRRQLREPVRFADAVGTLVESGHTVLLEMGPHPQLIGMARHFLPDGILGLSSLRRGQDDWETLLASLGALYVAGVDVDWAGFDRPYAPRRVLLPTYPFQRERYWHPALESRRGRRTSSHEGPPSLIGRPVLSPALTDNVFETILSADWPPFLAHHRIHGVVVLPSPAYLEMLLAAAKERVDGTPVVTDFQIHEGLVLPEEGERVVQTVLTPAGDQTEARVFSRAEGEDRWHLHAEARLETWASSTPEGPALDLAAVQARCVETLDAGAFYDDLMTLGLEFGPSFRGLRQIQRRDGEALGRMELPAELTGEAGSYGMHPALLDSCFHLLGAALGPELRGRTYLMIEIERFCLYYARPGLALWNHATLRETSAGSDETFAADVRLYDDDGRLVAEALGLHLKLASPEALRRIVRRQSSDLLYEVSWQPAPMDEAPSAETVCTCHVAERVAGQLAPLADQFDLDLYQDLIPALDRLSAEYVTHAFTKLGMTFQPGTTLEATSLAERFGVLPRYRRLLERLLTILTEDGALRRAGDHWEVARVAVPAGDLDACVADLHGRFPAAQAEITLTARCGAALADVLTGEADPLQLLFPDGSLAPLEQLYRHAPFARAFSGLVETAVAGIIASLPAERPLRVLEIGAGTGATTDAALAALPGDRTEYWFTDISPLFLERARERFTGVDGLRLETFDVERDPAEQGLPIGAFDIVIAANVIHATEDVRRSLANARRLLAPGGQLLLLEGTRPQRWIDLTFGLTEGWWRFTDTDVRPNYPLLSRDGWPAVLSELGFQDPSIIGYPESDSIDQVLILAGAGVKSATQPAHWLILGDTTDLATPLAEHLRARGERATVAPASVDISSILDSRSEGGTDLRVLYLSGLDAPAVDAPAEAQLAAGVEHSGEIVDLVRQLVDRGEPAELWLITRGAQPVTGTVVAPLQATIWGLGRVIALEHPEIWGGMVDLDPDSLKDTVDQLLAALAVADGEDQVALRGGQRLVARLMTAEAPPAVQLELGDDASYLIAGGTGGLGLKVARWLVESGARHLVLTGRTPLPPREQWSELTGGRVADQVAAVEAMESLGARVDVVAADVADRDQMATLFARFGRDLPPLGGIIHAAAHLGPFSLRELPSDELFRMLQPKLGGTLLLHELSRDMDIDFFALFSSTTALWGSSQLAHYAAANAYLDAFAHWRQGLALPALSLNWGTWDEMRVASDDDRQMVSGFGLNPLPSAVALDTLGTYLGTSTAQIAVASVDWQRLKPAYEVRRARPFLSLVGTREHSTTPVLAAAEVSARPALLERLELARQDDRRGVVADFVQAEVARTLGTSAGRAIDSQQGLFQLGMDSLMAVDLKGRLEAGIGRGLPSTVVFNHPTIDALTDFLLGELSEPAPAAGSNGASIAEPDVAPAQELPDLDELTEDELEQLLADRLARVSSRALADA